MTQTGATQHIYYISSSKKKNKKNTSTDLHHLLDENQPTSGQQRIVGNLYSGSPNVWTLLQGLCEMQRNIIGVKGASTTSVSRSNNVIYITHHQHLIGYKVWLKLNLHNLHCNTLIIFQIPDLIIDKSNLIRLRWRGRKKMHVPHKQTNEKQKKNTTVKGLHVLREQLF